MLYCAATGWPRSAGRCRSEGWARNQRGAWRQRHHGRYKVDVLASLVLGGCGSGDRMVVHSVFGQDTEPNIAPVWVPMNGYCSCILHGSHCHLCECWLVLQSFEWLIRLKKVYKWNPCTIWTITDAFGMDTNGRYCLPSKQLTVWPIK